MISEWLIGFGSIPNAVILSGNSSTVEQRTFSMMIHCKALLTVSVSTNEITSTGKNQLIQYPELTYLAIIASQQDWKIHLHWVNHVWTDRIGIEPIIAVLETAVLPIKLSTYKVMGNRTPTYGVKLNAESLWSANNRRLLCRNNPVMWVVWETTD